MPKKTAIKRQPTRQVGERKKVKRTPTVVASGTITKYQGREFKATIQAPSKEELEEMVDGIQEYAAEQGLDPIEVLQFRRDPDGGWECTISAHNWNPFKWIREKGGAAVRAVKSKARQAFTEDQPPELPAEERPEEGPAYKWFRTGFAKAKYGVGKVRKGIEERLPSRPETKKAGPLLLPPATAGGYYYPEYKKAEEERVRLEELLRQEQAARKKRATEEAEREYRGERGKVPTETEILERLRPKEREKYEKKLIRSREEAAKAQAEARLRGVSPAEAAQPIKVWKPGYTDPKTGEYHPGEYEIKAIPGRVLTPIELKAKTIAQTEELKGWERVRRERQLRPVKAIAGAVGGALASTIFAPKTSPLARPGTPRGFTPTGARGGAGLFSVPTPPAPTFRPTTSLEPLRGGVSLEHFRKMTVPTFRGRTKQV